LGIFFGIIYVAFSALYAVERTHMLIRGIFSVCPSCHQRADLPVYACPKCNVAHTRLIPGPYGILHRHCQCGHDLPASFLTGRGRLQARCVCGQSISGGGATAPLCFPIIGGPSAGKSCFLLALMDELLRTIATARGWSLDFENPDAKAELERVLTQFKGGILPQKTRERFAKSSRFFLRTRAQSVPRHVHIYDSAGEVFMAGDDLDQQHFYGYRHGFVFIVDLTSSHAIREAYAFSGNAATISQLDPADALNKALNKIEANYQNTKGTRFNEPLAIILNKVDALHLGSTLEPSAAPLGSSEARQRALDQRCRSFLNDHGYSNLVRLIDQKFAKTAFFPCVCAPPKIQGVHDAAVWLFQTSARELA